MRIEPPFAEYNQPASSVPSQRPPVSRTRSRQQRRSVLAVELNVPVRQLRTGQLPVERCVLLLQAVVRPGVEPEVRPEPPQLARDSGQQQPRVVRVDAGWARAEQRPD